MELHNVADGVLYNRRGSSVSTLSILHDADKAEMVVESKDNADGD